MSRIIFTRLNLALLVAMICATVAGFSLLPAQQQLPYHWNWRGEVDASGAREWVLLMLPLFAGVMTAVFVLAGRWSARVNALRGGRQYALGLSSALAVFVAIQAMIVCYGLGYMVNALRTIAFVTALFFIALGNLLPKMQPGAAGFGWPKSPDPAQQRRAQRLTGMTMMVSGACLLIAAIFDPPPVWFTFGLLFAALAPAFVGIAAALLMSRR